MRIPRVYLETTIFNFPYVDDSPQYRQDTLDFFHAINTGRFKPYTSAYTLLEIDDTPEKEKRYRMKQLIPEYGIAMLEKNWEAESLADIYLAENVISLRFRTDAIHIAMTAIYGLNFIVSLNFQHIVRPWTIEKVAIINAREGYREIGIYKPREALDENF
ncbi:hypothetical protein LQZ19_13235 [Treponema primitia]|uniref:hypothetical protein n=1 Tax=Treponema primitia TaxID=88058 RepID=UPI0039817438